MPGGIGTDDLLFAGRAKYEPVYKRDLMCLFLSPNRLKTTNRALFPANQGLVCKIQDLISTIRALKSHSVHFQSSF